MNLTLNYPGKLSKAELLTNTRGFYLSGEEQASSKNKLILGDNLLVLKALLNQYQGMIDMVYIDPPYATNNTFLLDDERANTISRHRNGRQAYSDTLKGYHYLEFLRQRLILIRELMSSQASIYLHIDYKVGHYVKLIMDEVFGIQNYRNEISRIKCNPKNFQRKGYGNIKDMVLFYSKSDAMIWNEPFKEYSEEDIKRLYPKVNAQGRRYTTVPLHAPGETVNGSSSNSFKGKQPPKGRHWRTSPEELEKLDREGKIEWSASGIPRKIIYLDEMPGKRVQDIWEFKDPQYPTYPTEKNRKMLEMIVKASSHQGSLVLDCFCGSGTTLLAANSLERNWIGIDNSEEAIAVARNQLRKESVLDLQDYEFMVLKEEKPAVDLLGTPPIAVVSSIAIP